MTAYPTTEPHVLLDSINSIVWEYDLATSCFTTVSRQAERLLGYPVERWLAEPDFWERHMHPDDRAWALSYCQAETTRQRGHEFDYRMVADDGRVVWLRDVVTVVVENGAPVRLRGIMVDITREKAVELERDALLQRERQARTEAEEALRIRDDFFMIASHELATPLTPLLLRIQALRRQLERKAADDPTFVDAHRGVAAIERTAEHFRSLVSSLLDVAELRSKALVCVPSRVDLAELVRDVVRGLAGAQSLSGSTVRLTATGAVIGEWDAKRMLEVISNLVANAIKFAPGLPVDVTVARHESVARLDVRDRGPGIPMVDAERIFGCYERAATARSYGGFGLGLYVARRIVEAHGGTIRLGATDGPGATFRVELPLMTSPALGVDVEAGQRTPPTPATSPVSGATGATA